MISALRWIFRIYGLIVYCPQKGCKWVFLFIVHWSSSCRCLFTIEQIRRCYLTWGMLNEISHVVEMLEQLVVLVVTVFRRRPSEWVLWHRWLLSVTSRATPTLWSWQAWNSHALFEWRDCIVTPSDTLCEWLLRLVFSVFAFAQHSVRSTGVFWLSCDIHLLVADCYPTEIKIKCFSGFLKNVCSINVNCIQHQLVVHCT